MLIARIGQYPGYFESRVNMQYEWAHRSLRLGELEDAALRLVDVVILADPKTHGSLRSNAIEVLKAASSVCPDAFASALNNSKRAFLDIAVDSYLKHDLEAAKRCLSLISDASSFDRTATIEYLALKSSCTEVAEPAIVELCMSADKESLRSVRVGLDESFMKLATEARLAGRFEEHAHYLDAFEELSRKIESHPGSMQGLLFFQLEQSVRLLHERNFKSALDVLLKTLKNVQKNSRLSRFGETALESLSYLERDLRVEEERLALLCKQRAAAYAMSPDVAIPEESVAEYNSLLEAYRQIAALLEKLP